MRISLGRKQIATTLQSITKGHATKIINEDNKEMIPVTIEEQELTQNQTECYIWKRKFQNTADKRYYIK